MDNDDKREKNKIDMKFLYTYVRWTLSHARFNFRARSVCVSVWELQHSVLCRRIVRFAEKRTSYIIFIIVDKKEMYHFGRK